MKHEDLEAVGWDPCNPSADAITATVRPAMPSLSSERDRMGVHRRLLRVEIIRRFHDAFRKEYEQTQMKVVEVAATLFALRASEIDLGLIDPPRYEAMRLDLDAWEAGPLAESDARLTVALRDERLWPEIRGNSGRYEPALTYRLLLFERCPTDFQGNRRAAAQILRAVEMRGVLPSHFSSVDEQLSELPEWTDESVEGLLHLLTAKNAGQPLFHPTTEGKWRLGTEEGRDALEFVVSRVEPIREEDRRKAPASPSLVPTDETAGAGRDTDHRYVDEIPAAFDRGGREMSPADSAAASEMAQMARGWLRDRRDRADAGSSEALAAEFFLRSPEQDVTMESLARERGMPPRTLRNACHTMKEELRQFLHARGCSDDRPGG